MCRPLPDIDALLVDQWSAEVEDLIIRERTVPSIDLECDLHNYLDICCGTVQYTLSDQRLCKFILRG